MKRTTRQAQPPATCKPASVERLNRSWLLGLVYGLVPHTFCILFIVLSIVGATAATSVVGRFLYLPYFFQILVALSLVFATISAAFYLKRNGILSLAGARFKWKYLAVMYGTTIAVNLLFFWVIFPAVAGVDFQKQDVVLAAPAPVVTQASRGVLGGSQGPAQAAPATAQTVRLQVQIPCPGHAPLISGELKKAPGVTAVKYESPNYFRVSFDPGKLTVDKILALEVFQYFPASVKP